LARVADPKDRDKVLAKLFDLLSSRTLVEKERLIALRALELAFIRLGPPDEKDKVRFLTKLESFYPAETFAENYLLCELFAYLDSPGLLAPTLKLLAAAENQEEQMYYIYSLRNLSKGWTLDQRRAYLAAVKKMESFRGSNYLQRFLTFIRSDVLASLNEIEQRELATLIASLGRSDEPALPTVVNRPFVRDWKLEEVLASLGQAKDKQRSLEHGREMFAVALCNRCHRLGEEGGAIGPDLSSASARYSRKDLVDAIVNPSRVIDEKYRDTRILTSDGEFLVGQLAGGDKDQLFFSTNVLEPSLITRIRRDHIESRQASFVSPMPMGLLSTLTEEEVLDLMAWVESGGRKAP